MKKENVIVIFGGKSTEHDISIITGLQVLSNIDAEKYNAIPIYISKTGLMFTDTSLGLISTYFDFKDDNKKFKKASFISGSNLLFVSRNLDKKLMFKPTIKISCAVICCHGINGEDGTLQGLLELSNIPYTSPGVLASAVSMDKIIMKDIFVANHIVTAKYVFFNSRDFKLDSNKVVEEIEEKLSYPFFVKPANLGSSIGISKCKDRKGLESAIEIAINYDSRILVEESVENNIEVNCAVFGNADYQIASKIEYPKTWSDFLSFDEKYIQRNKDSTDGKFVERDKKSEKNTDLEKKSEIDKSVQKLNKKTEIKVQGLAKKVFKIFDCSGVVRIDFLIERKTNLIYLNEINTIPGSLAFYLFKDIGYSFKELLNRLIDLSKKEKIRKDESKFSYQSLALMNFGKGEKGNKHK